MSNDMVRDFTRLTLENENGAYSIQIHKVEISSIELLDDYVIPILRAAGYAGPVLEQLQDMVCADGTE